MTGAVGIEEDGAQLDEHLGHERFAACDAADEADGFHAGPRFARGPIVAGFYVDFERDAKWEHVCISSRTSWAEVVDFVRRDFEDEFVVDLQEHVRGELFLRAGGG